MGSKHTRLRIINDTNSDITTTAVSEIADFDWDYGNSRPDRNFHNVFIASRGSREQRAEINATASHCPFTMTLRYRDGSSDTFRIHQRHAIGCCAGFQHFQKSHDIYYSRVGENLLQITVKNTHQQLENERAEERARKKAAEEAKKKAEEAKQKAEEEAKKQAEETKKKAEEEARRKVEEKARQETELKTKVEELKKECEAALNEKQYETALKKLEEASSLAKETSIVDSITADRVLVLTRQGQSLLQRGWELEQDLVKDEARNAEVMFGRAKDLFDQAQRLVNTPELEHYMNLVILKVEANKLSNEAIELEEQAMKLFNVARRSQVAEDYNAAQNKYREALEKYRDAEKKFDEGSKHDEKFEECSKLMQTQITEIGKVIGDIEKEELRHNITQINLKEKVKDKEEKVGTSQADDLQQQI